MSEEEPGPRAGHLGTAWEIAVVAAFVVVIIIVIGVVTFHIRRRQRRSQVAEVEDAVPRKKKRRRGKKVESVQIEVKDLESGQCEVVTEVPDQDDYVDSELEDAHIDPKSTPVRPKSSSKAKPKPPRSKKSVSLKDGVDLSSEDYYFEHPSQKPPKYYWDQR